MKTNFFADRLKRLREEKNLSQKQVAKVLGISLTTYSYIENEAKHSPESDILEKLARLFFVPISALTGIDPDGKKSASEEEFFTKLNAVNNTGRFVFSDSEEPIIRPKTPEGYAMNEENIVNTEEAVNKEEPEQMRDLRYSEQELVLFFRLLSIPEQRKYLDSIEKLVRKNEQLEKAKNPEKEENKENS